MSAQASLWPNIEKPFFEDLERISQKCGRWDFIMFSGDLVQKGDPKEYVKLNETLKRLYERLHSLGSDPVLLVVPGNHDLKRPASSDENVQKLQRFHQDMAVSNEFWGNSGSPLRHLVKNAFAPFVRWYKNHPFAKPAKFTQGILPGDFSATIEKRDIRIGIVGLNSAFLQLQEGDYRGKLALSTNQLISVCGEHFTDWFDKHTVCFLMTHHPPSWLAHNSREVLHNDIALPGRFVAHLCGHLHEPCQETIVTGGDPEARRCWQGRALFGLEFYGDTGQQYERSHGYSAGMVDVDNEGGAVRLWPRQANKLQSGKWNFGDDRSAIVQQDAGTSPEPVTVGYQGEKATPAGPQKNTRFCFSPPTRTLVLHARRWLSISGAPWESWFRIQANSTIESTISLFSSRRGGGTTEVVHLRGETAMHPRRHLLWTKKLTGLLGSWSNSVQTVS